MGTSDLPGDPVSLDPRDSAGPPGPISDTLWSRAIESAFSSSPLFDSPDIDTLLLCTPDDGLDLFLLMTAIEDVGREVFLFGRLFRDDEDACDLPTAVFSERERPSVSPDAQRVRDFGDIAPSPQLSGLLSMPTASDFLVDGDSLPFDFPLLFPFLL